MPYDATFTKDPDAVLDYTRDWKATSDPWLADAETISTSTWVVPSGITEDSSTNDDTTTTIWLSGGTDGTDYEITNRITTSASRTDDRTFRIQVRER